MVPKSRGCCSASRGLFVAARAGLSAFPKLSEFRKCLAGSRWRLRLEGTMPSEMRLRGSRSQGGLTWARGQHVAGMEIGRPWGWGGVGWGGVGWGGGGGDGPPDGIIICRQLASSGKLDIIPCQSYALRAILSFVILPWALIIECFHQCFHPAASPAWAPETPALPSLPAPAAGI